MGGRGRGREGQWEGGWRKNEKKKTKANKNSTNALTKHPSTIAKTQVEKCAF